MTLGAAVESSGLLRILGERVGEILENAPLPLAIAVVFSILAVSGNFLSSTVLAILAMPFCIKIGASLGHAEFFAIGGVCVISGSMSLPISSFPNSFCASLQSLKGGPILSTRDFIRVGFPASAAVTALAVTAGAAWAILVLGW